jgi:hypothetical protein
MSFQIYLARCLMRLPERNFGEIQILANFTFNICVVCYNRASYSHLGSASSDFRSGSIFQQQFKRNLVIKTGLCGYFVRSLASVRSR